MAVSNITIPENVDWNLLVDRLRVIRRWISGLKPELREALELEQTAPFYIARAIVHELDDMDITRISMLALNYVREISVNGPLANALPESDSESEENALFQINFYITYINFILLC